MPTTDIETKIVQKYLKYLISVEPILKEIQSCKTIHTGGFRYKNEKRELLTPLNQFSITIEFAVEDIVNYNIEKFSESIYKLTYAIIENMHKMIFDNLTIITDFTGNVINGKGKPFSFDLYLDMLKKTEIRFDDNGNPILPSIVAGHELSEKINNIKMTKEQEERRNQIIDTKRNQYYAKKCNRRLSYIY